MRWLKDNKERKREKKRERLQNAVLRAKSGCAKWSLLAGHRRPYGLPGIKSW